MYQTVNRVTLHRSAYGLHSLNPNLLRWACEHARITQEDLVVVNQETGRTGDRLRAAHHEAGGGIRTRRPSGGQLPFPLIGDHQRKQTLATDPALVRPRAQPTPDTQSICYNHASPPHQQKDVPQATWKD